MTAKVCAALVAAQADLRNPAKDRTANTGTYSYKYADLASILDLVRPVLAKHGLAITQDVRMEDCRLLIHSRLIHSSGECLDFGPLAGSVGTSWQQTGGGITYARRYALQAILGIAADEDDDAATAPPPPAKGRQRLQAVPDAVDHEAVGHEAVGHEAVEPETWRRCWRSARRNWPRHCRCAMRWRPTWPATSSPCCAIA